MPANMDSIIFTKPDRVFNQDFSVSGWTLINTFNYFFKQLRAETSLPLNCFLTISVKNKRYIIEYLGPPPPSGGTHVIFS